MEPSLNLLVTANIRGDLELLPRLYSFMRTLRQGMARHAPIAPSPDANYGVPTILVDLGQSCVPEVWHCEVTQGRSTLLVLDAMGYDAVNVTGVLTSENRAKLITQVAVGLVDAEHSFEKRGIEFICHDDHGTGDVGRGVLAGRPYDGRLMINLCPIERTRLENGVLTLAAVERAEVGLIAVHEGELHHEVHTMPGNLTPDATIAGVVDFVISEARYSQKKRGSG